jgi:hypothetical protein
VQPDAGTRTASLLSPLRLLSPLPPPRLHSIRPFRPQPRELALEWAWRVSEEFFLQGDREAELGLPVSPFMDRRKDSVARTIVNCQVGFINVLVRPLFEEWLMFLGDAAERYHLERDIMTPLAANLRLLEAEGVSLFDSCAALGQVDPLLGWSKRRSLFANGPRIQNAKV